MTKGKKTTGYWIEFSQLNGRDSNMFIANEMEIQDNGFVKAIGSYKRRKAIVTLLIPTTSIVSMEETELGSEQEEDKGGI